MSKRKQHAPEFKAKVALEVLKGEETATDLATRFGMHPTMIHQWKRALLEGASGVFERGGRKEARDRRGSGQGAPCQDRGAGGGQLFFGTKAQTLGREVRRGMVEPGHPHLSIGRQCALLSISRASFYSAPKGRPSRTSA